TLDGGTGSLQVDLPQSSGHFRITLDMSTGNVTLHSPEGATYDLKTDGGTGNLVIDLDEGSGVQVKVIDSGLGNLRIADNFKKVREGGDVKEGTWQNEAYSTSSAPIRIELDLGTGNVEIR
ncbi:MAG: hypothetical protein IH586_09795, partial [Anaerolineaceae bacterium]|nr:hypothetical protein [Anaerolineaceae bacterium]